MKFTATLLAIMATLSVIVTAADMTVVKVESNAQRLARGLPPLKPKSLLGRGGDHGHGPGGGGPHPHPSPVPKDPNPFKTPCGKCGCTYRAYSLNIGDGTLPVHGSDATPIETCYVSTAAACELKCDNIKKCKSGLFSNGLCTLYEEFASSGNYIKALSGTTYFHYTLELGKCTGTCF